MTANLPKTVEVVSEDPYLQPGRRATYRVDVDGGEVILSPLTDRGEVDYSGNYARSTIGYQDYRYTHGGGLYRAAVRKAKELASQL